MAVMRDRPCVNSNFLVDLGEGDARSAAAGFAEVIFPEFTIGHEDPRKAGPGKSPIAESADATAGNRLVLRRGLIGALDLYGWWNSARHGKAPKRRTVTIELLSEDHSTVVVTWRFHNAYPVTLSYTPLRAIEGTVVMESVELAFDSMEMS